VGLLLPGLNFVGDLVVSLSTQIDSFIATLPDWLSALAIVSNLLGWLLRILLVVVLLVVTGFLLVQFGVILGSPWYGQLSEQLEQLRIGKQPTFEGGIGAIFQDIWRAIMFEVKKLILALGLSLILLLLNVVPVLGAIAASIGGIAIAATIVCLDFLDAPLERRRLRFRDKLKIAFGSLPASATFALVCLGLVSIPIVNFVTIPLCVSGGTLFFCDRIWPKKFAPQSGEENQTTG
jgi:CysZ protein